MSAIIYISNEAPCSSTGKAVFYGVCEMGWVLQTFQSSWILVHELASEVYTRTVGYGTPMIHPNAYQIWYMYRWIHMHACMYLIRFWNMLVPETWAGAWDVGWCLRRGLVPETSHCTFPLLYGILLRTPRGGQCTALDPLDRALINNCVQAPHMELQLLSVQMDNTCLAVRYVIKLGTFVAFRIKTFFHVYGITNIPVAQHDTCVDFSFFGTWVTSLNDVQKTWLNKKTQFFNQSRCICISFQSSLEYCFITCAGSSGPRNRYQRSYPRVQ